MEVFFRLVCGAACHAEIDTGLPMSGCKHSVECCTVKPVFAGGYKFFLKLLLSSILEFMSL